MKGIFILFFLMLCIHGSFSQSGPSIVNNIVIGGNTNDKGLGMDTTTDRGLIIAGITTSSSNSTITRRVENSNSDALVLRYDQAGTLLWSKCFGGTNNDVMNDIIQTTDGGFIAVGKSNSVDYDLPTTNDGTFSNIWVVKLSAAGNIEWSKNYGGTQAEDAVSVLQLADGSYVVAGYSESTTATSPFGTALGAKDLVLIKLDASGNDLLFRRMGGNRDDYPARIIQLANGNFVVVGSTTTPNNGIITGNHNTNLTADIWVVWLDNNLNHLENRCYGSTGVEIGVSVEEMSNGELIIGGSVTYINNGDLRQVPNHGTTEGWLARINKNVARPYDTVWTRSYGGSDNDNFRSMVKTIDGHVVIGMMVQSPSNPATDITDKISSGNTGDVWLAKINTSNGEIFFRRSYGTTVADDVDKIMLWKSDNLLSIGTLQGSIRDGDLTGQPAFGGTDLWMASYKDIIILPVLLSGFSGKSYDTYNLLEWQTSSESNSKEFRIERSEDGRVFKVIGVVRAAGESAMPKQYSFKDEEPLQTATYRIQLVDKDGSKEYSRVIVLRKNIKNTIVEKVYMQHNGVVFLINSDIDQQATLQLLNTNGRTVATQKITLSKGFNNPTLSTGYLPSGMYVGVVNYNGSVNSVKVVK